MDQNTQKRNEKNIKTLIRFFRGNEEKSQILDSQIAALRGGYDSMKNIAEQMGRGDRMPTFEDYSLKIYNDWKSYLTEKAQWPDRFRSKDSETADAVITRNLEESASYTAAGMAVFGIKG